MLPGMLLSETLPPGGAPRPGDPRAGSSRRRAGLWAALALVFLWVAAAVVYPPITKYDLYDPGLGGRLGDVGQYVRMYQGVSLREVPKPFRYRVFTPWAARLVPPVPQPLLRYFDVSPEKLVKYRFGIVNLLGLALTGLLLVAFCEGLGFALRDGLVAALLFFTSFPVINFGGTPMVDAWAYAFLMMGLVAALNERRAWLCVACLVGVMAKETTLLLVPAALLLPGAPRLKAGRLLALLPGAIAYAVFRFALFPTRTGWSYDPATLATNLADSVTPGPYHWWNLFDGGTAFGLLWPLALLGAWELRRRPHEPLARLAWLVPGLLALPFLIGSNIGRIWFYAFPVVLPLAVSGLRRMRVLG